MLLLAVGVGVTELIDVVSRQLIQVLGLRACRVEYGVAGLGQPARLCDDGQVEWRQGCGMWKEGASGGR